MSPWCIACLLLWETGVTVLSSCSSSSCCSILDHFLTFQNESWYCIQMKARLRICLCLDNCLWIKIIDTIGLCDLACAEAWGQRCAGDRGVVGGTRCVCRFLLVHCMPRWPSWLLFFPLLSSSASYSQGKNIWLLFDSQLSKSMSSAPWESACSLNAEKRIPKREETPFCLKCLV